MSEIQKAQIQRAATLVHRSPRTIRRWIAQGADIRDEGKLKRFANEVGARTFGRYGNGARSIGKKGGLKTSSVKRQSSKLNGKRGGRHKDGMFLLKKAIRNGNQLDLRSASDDDLKALWPALVEIGKWHLFWTGDALNEIFRRHGEFSARLASKQSPEPIEFWHAATVSRVLVPEDRNSLTYKHHVAAIAETGGNITDIRIWLKIAEEQCWTRPQLRAAIREARAEHSQQKRTKGTKTITGELHRLTSRVKEVISKRPVKEWSLEEVNVFLDDAELLAETIEDAQNRWNDFAEIKI